MPASLLTDLIVRPLFELAIYGLGYLTGHVMVPMLTLGRYTVETWDFQHKSKKRDRPRSLTQHTVSAEVAIGVGLATWVVAILVGYVLWSTGSA